MGRKNLFWERKFPGRLGERREREGKARALAGGAGEKKENSAGRRGRRTAILIACRANQPCGGSGGKKKTP